MADAERTETSEVTLLCDDGIWPCQGYEHRKKRTTQEIYSDRPKFVAWNFMISSPRFS